PYASLPKIRLTTVLQPKDNIGRESVRILFEKLENKDIHTGLQRIIQPELKIRSTCKSVL
ncbi:MAG: LacI family transcriptional regulator, partial [Clostridiaceae bacterium]|nr:LacI family transcriptional regulator [Clostridiaceae bacterium]